jgi:carbon-monoxide dehydrogenase medium subunit
MTIFYRRLPKFDYVSPKSLSEAWELMQGTKGIDYQVYAGGTDVIPKLKRRQGHVPKCLIDLKGVEELDYIRYDEDAGLAIGALASVYAVANSCLVRDRYPALAIAAGRIAAIHIQNRATVVGNICNAVPSADTAPSLLALDAQIRCASAAGQRTVPVKDFFVGPLQTVLSDGEIVTDILIPRSSAGPNSTYIKLQPRRSLDLAIVGVAAFVQATNGKCDDIRIGLGAVAPTPLRALDAESALRGGQLTDESIEAAAKTAGQECSPIDDHRGSAAYRRAMVEVLTARAIKQCLSGKPEGARC